MNTSDTQEAGLIDITGYGAAGLAARIGDSGLGRALLRISGREEEGAYPGFSNTI